MSNNITLEQVIIWVQQLQDQNKIDFQAIKLINKTLDKLKNEIEKGNNLNNLVIKKMMYEYNQLKKIIIDENVALTLNQKIIDSENKNKKKIEEVDNKLKNEINEVSSQLEQSVQYQDQEDFVESLSHNMCIKEMTILCNDVQTGNYSIFYDIGNNKAIGYYTETQMSDDYILLKGGRCGELGTQYITKGSIRHNRKEGNFVEDYIPNCYALKGSKLFYENISNVEQLAFYSFVDNRGGIWRCTLSNTNGIVGVVDISVFSSQAGFSQKVLFSDLNRDSIYTLILEFIGDDPLNPPIGGTSRGWYIIKDHTIAYESLLLKQRIINIVNQKTPLQAQSNKDFAFLLKKKGASYTEQFFPLHSGVKTSYKVNEPIILVDNVNVRDVLVPGNDLKVKNNITFIQKVDCKIPDDINTILGTMTSKYIFRKDGGVELINRFEVKEDIDIRDGYVNMFPIDSSICPILKTSCMNKYDITKPSGLTNLLEGNKALSYIAGGGDNDICVAMSTINPFSTLRKNKDGKRNPLTWIEHRSSNFQKLYPQVFQNGGLSRGETYIFGCKFIVCYSDFINDMYI